MKSLIDQLNWRYATKKMNGKIVEDDKLNRILQAIQLSPSSMGVMPYNVLIVKSKQVRQRIHAACYNQPQIVECDTLLIFTTWKKLHLEKVENLLELHQSINHLDEEKSTGLRAMMLNATTKMSDEQFFNWACRQTYIALGLGLAAAALEEVDSTPMEGFSVDELDKALSLDELNLSASVLLALGHRDETTDYLVKLKKVRRNFDDIFISYL